MSKELEQKSAALEQTLEKQLSVFKKGSEDWVKVGAVVAVGALVVYGLTQLSYRKKEKNTDKALAILEREGLLNPEIKDRLTQPNSSSIWTSLAQKVLFLGLALAKDKLYEQFFAGEEKTVEKKDNI